MARFSNGSEGRAYESAYCENCANYFDRNNIGSPSCPIWESHFMFNGTEQEDAQAILDTLIPVKMTEHGEFAGDCSMFRKKEKDA